MYVRVLPPEFNMCYVVLNIVTGREVYAGRSESQAAIALKRGTQYGKHKSPSAARWLAERNRRLSAQVRGI